MPDRDEQWPVPRRNRSNDTERYSLLDDMPFVTVFDGFFRQAQSRGETRPCTASAQFKLRTHATQRLALFFREEYGEFLGEPASHLHDQRR